MAFNRQTFKTRALTAVVFVIVMLGGLLWNQWSFLVLFSIIHFGCWWEYFKLAEKIHQTTFHPYTKMGLMVMGYGLMIWFCGPGYHFNIYGLKENFSLPVSAAGFALLLIGVFQKNAIKPKAFAMAMLGLAYISLSWGLMIDLRSESIELSAINIEKLRNGTMNTSEVQNLSLFEVKAVWMCLLAIFTMWINDTMAYIVGSLIGKTPLSKISPKKTWEGTVGGIILASLLLGLFGYYCLNEFYITRHSFFEWTALVLVAAIAGTFGDLLESKLKRMAGVKDSGSLMPGHGGFLDRFDSLLLATPFVWLYIQLFMR